MKIVFALLAFVPFPVIATCDIFDENQRIILQKAYDSGKPHDLSWTLSAIVWKESSAGKNLANWRDPSVGPFHNLLFSVARREGVEGNPMLELAILNKLMYDFDFAAKHAIYEVKYWLKVHNGDWKKTWASYNAGWKWEKGKQYSNDIYKKIQYLKQHGCVSDVG